MENREVTQHLRFNFLVNTLDGGFFGLGMGFASFVTVLPLFISTMTDSAVLIGLIPAIHNMGWQLPQLLVAKRISGLPRYKQLTMFLTIQERLPFLGLALLAFLLPTLGNRTGLVIAFLLLIWQGLGAGLAANPWQNLIGRVIPGEYRATFFGVQSAAANLLSSISAIIAGIILARIAQPLNFAYNFTFTSLFMLVSWFFLAQTREPFRSQESIPQLPVPFWNHVVAILKSDRNFRWFVITRMMSQFAMMAGAFYIVYAVRFLDMDEITAGILTSVLLVTQVAANPILGRVADLWSRKNVLALGVLSSGLSALTAFLAPSLAWFYPVVILYGIGNTAFWTIGIALNMEFGTEAERPAYIGLANTLIAPVTILAPFTGGILADSAGYQTTFIVSALSALITFFSLSVFVKDPGQAEAMVVEESM